ncbi:MAG: hypothetical protein BWY47_00626 [Bacteroidetes bacterium ADurb.Bin302]|nr:MAG: hypothetical protein BWY47_00626 [Bacteroidetes bacterium ADurb.Bin302]
MIAAYTIIPVGLNGGVVNANTAKIAYGIAPNNKYGRNLPQRVFVLSVIMPTIGSTTASHILPANIIQPATIGEMPNTSV